MVVTYWCRQNSIGW